MFVFLVSYHCSRRTISNSIHRDSGRKGKLKMNARRNNAEMKNALYTAIARLPENSTHRTPEIGHGFQYEGYDFEHRFPLAINRKSVKSNISIINGVDFIMNGVKYETKINCSTIGTIKENGISFPMLNSDFLVYNPFFDCHMNDAEMIENTFVIRPAVFLEILEKLNMFKDLRPYRNKVQIQVYKTSKKKTKAFIEYLSTFGVPATDFFLTECPVRVNAENTAKNK